MNVSEVARLAGIAPTAVRFYERRGVLPPAARLDNGYRDYTEGDLCPLRLVVSLRSLGLDLEVAARLSGMCADGRCDEVSHDLGPFLAVQRAAIARSQAQMAELDSRLATLEVTLAAGEPDSKLCQTKGGELDDELRLRAELPMPTGRLPALTHG
jgi:DNA-binding transcriptional MerR regulator